jgi:DNA-binding response OmpR family regulator
MTLKPDPTSFAKRSVLCVQPNEDYHPALRLALSKYRIVMVPGALEAIRTLNAHSFDAHIIDYWLPDWSGSSLCRQIRQSDPHAPIVFFAEADGAEQKKRALRAGADAYVHAPDGTSVLATKLRNLLEQADLRAMRARIDEENAIQLELQRRAALLISQSEHAKERAALAAQRAAQARARKAFIEAGGTLATFHRWWPQSFGSALANHHASGNRRVPLADSTEGYD